MGDFPFTVAILVVQGVCIIYMYIIYIYAPSPKQEDPSQKTQVNRLAEVSSFPMVCLCFLFITRWILVLGTFLPTTLFVSQLKSPPQLRRHFNGLISGRGFLSNEVLVDQSTPHRTPRGFAETPKNNGTLSTSCWRGIIGGHLEKNFRGGFHGTMCACFWLLFLMEF